MVHCHADSSSFVFFPHDSLLMLQVPSSSREADEEALQQTEEREHSEGEESTRTARSTDSRPRPSSRPASTPGSKKQKTGEMADILRQMMEDNRAKDKEAEARVSIFVWWPLSCENSLFHQFALVQVIPLFKLDVHLCFSLPLWNSQAGRGPAGAVGCQR